MGRIRPLQVHKEKRFFVGRKNKKLDLPIGEFSKCRKILLDVN